MEIFSVWLIRQKQALKALQLQTLLGRKKGPVRSAVRGGGVALAFASGGCTTGDTRLGQTQAGSGIRELGMGNHISPGLNPDTRRDLNSLHAFSGEEWLWVEMWREAAWGRGREGGVSQRWT